MSCKKATDHSNPREQVFLSVIIPVCNEEHRLPRALERLSTYLDAQPYGSEILVAENGSSDRTLEVAVEAVRGRPGRRVLQVAERAKGLAVRRGMLAAGGLYRFMCDVDLSMPVAEIAGFVPPALQGADVAIGSREAEGSRVVCPRRRRLIGRAFNAMARALVLPGIRDTQCGFKCFSAAAAERIFPRQRIKGLAFDVELLCIARRQGLCVVEVPITWRHDTDSRIRAGIDPVRMAADLLAIRRNDRRGLYG